MPRMPWPRLAVPAVLAALAVFAALASICPAEYKDTTPRKPADGEIEVTAPGSFAQTGKTYVLTQDISGPMTPVFLGKDVTLDLNGHSITFAAGKYEHVPNYGFEEGLTGWDVTKAPSAKVVPSAVRPMVGEKILQFRKGEEIVSQYITLPVADRSYYAMCAVATKEMSVTINVEDEKGNPVTCNFKGGKDKRVTPPEINRHPELGGGVIFAHVHHQPAGKYRVRIKAEAEDRAHGCVLIDECDLRPALDAGVGIVGGIAPWATYNDLLKWYPCAFFDYCKKDTGGEAMDGIPVIKKDTGTVTIRNGVIRNGTAGIRTLGVQSNAANVTVVLDNVKIVNSGINANAAQLSKGTLKDCRFEVDTPFIINRHNTSEASVNIEAATEIAGCEFIGGQGNFSGGCPSIHDNLFVNGQTVTNHYSIGPRSGTKVFRNRFLPKVGSGIYIGSGTGVEVYDNVFKIECAPPNCEYRYTAYSTNALRISDYDAKPDAPAEKRCSGNKVYNNKILITGKSYPQYDRYEPRAYAFFISVGGGTNYVYDNEITVEKQGDGNARAYAFFIGGSSNGGEIRNNKVTSNCPAAWVGNDYGNAANTVFEGNTFTKAAGTADKVCPFILGDGGNSVKDIGLFSNTFQGWGELFEYHANSITYAFGSVATVKVAKAGQPAAGAEVTAADSAGKEGAKQKTDDKGIARLRLPQYTYTNGKKAECGPYVIRCGPAEAKADASKDTDVRLEMK
jgi:hypothetical protein